MLQKKLLEQAGYVENDKLEDLGREDNSYLVRFTFKEATNQIFEVSCMQLVTFLDFISTSFTSHYSSWISR